VVQGVGLEFKPPYYKKTNKKPKTKLKQKDIGVLSTILKKDEQENKWSERRIFTNT
jgi:hypothetical protein